MKQEFPIHPSPSDGPWGANRKSLQELVETNINVSSRRSRSIQRRSLRMSPGTSDKLAQRNLAIVESANPGVVGSRRIPSTSEIRPTSVQLPEGAPHDELMLDWGRTPVGSVATIIFHPSTQRRFSILPHRCIGPATSCLSTSTRCKHARAG